MITELDPVGFLAAVSLGLISLILGLRMVIKPEGLSRRSFIYRYMAQRIGYVSNRVARTGKLSHKQIRTYGLWLIILGVLSFAVAFSIIEA